jgi:hypothetical protein
MNKTTYQVGDEIRVNEQWFIITSIEADSFYGTVIFATDQDGGDHEINPSKID